MLIVRAVVANRVPVVGFNVDAIVRETNDVGFAVVPIDDGTLFRVGGSFRLAPGPVLVCGGLQYPFATGINLHFKLTLASIPSTDRPVLEYGLASWVAVLHHVP